MTANAKRAIAGMAADLIPQTVSWISEYNYDEWLVTDTDALFYMVNAYFASYALGMESEKETQIDFSYELSRYNLRLNLSTLSLVDSRHMPKPSSVFAYLTMSRRGENLWGLLPGEYTDLRHTVDFHSALCLRGSYWGRDEEHRQRMSALFDEDVLDRLQIVEPAKHEDAMSFESRYSGNAYNAVISLLCSFQFEFETKLESIEGLAIDLSESPTAIELTVQFGGSKPATDSVASRPLLIITRIGEERFKVCWWPVINRRGQG